MKKGGSYVIDREVNVDAREAELFSGLAQGPASTVWEAKQAVRPKSELKQVRFAIGAVEECAADLGGADASEAEIAIDIEEELEEARCTNGRSPAPRRSEPLR